MNQANLKSRLRIELLALLTLSIVFLVLFPQRSTIVDFGLGLFALLLLGLNARFTKTTVWGQFPPAGREEDRFRTCLRIVFTITLPLVIGMFGAGLIRGYVSGGWAEAFNRVSNWHLLIVLILYFPWALLQQTLFQFYLFGHLLSLVPQGLAITCTGLAYGLVLPDSLDYDRRISGGYRMDIPVLSIPRPDSPGSFPCRLGVFVLLLGLWSRFV